MTTRSALTRVSGVRRTTAPGARDRRNGRSRRPADTPRLRILRVAGRPAGRGSSAATVTLRGLSKEIWRLASQRPENARRAEESTMATMRAMSVPAPGAKLCSEERSVPAPGRDEVRVRVQACGVCHSDSMTVGGAPGLSYPRIPGHEVIGVVDAAGEGVTAWQAGTRVGVGW